MKILVCLPRFPYPLNKGDKLRAFNQIRELSRRHDIYLFSLCRTLPKREDVAELRKYCKDIRIEKLSLCATFFSLIRNSFTTLPFQVALFTTNKSRRKFIEYCNEVKAEGAYFQFVRSAEYARSVRQTIDTNTAISRNMPQRLVLDFQDCLSMNMYRRANISKGLVKRFFMLETKRLRNYEDAMYDLFDCTCIITSQDRDCIISQRRKETKIAENGVDDRFFHYKGKQDKKYDIIFSGNMSYKPNVVAAVYLIKEIMPLVWKKFPKTKVVLAGSNPTKEVKNLASDRVFVTGWVEDMRVYYAQSHIFVAPMQIGTGLQNKLLEAMASKLPCITTSLANNALQSEPNKAILVGNTAEEIAKDIIYLLKSPDKRHALAFEGNKFVKENYDWAKSVSKLESLFTKRTPMKKQRV